MKIISLIIFILYFNSIKAGAESEVLGQTASGAAVGAGTGMAANAAKEEVIKNNPAFGEMSKKVGNFLQSPIGVSIVSGIGLANSYTLRSAAQEQSQESEDNIKKIERLMAEFKDSFANDCLNGRNSLNEPKCYCYVESGAKNPNRSNSKVCQDLWSKYDYMLSATPGDYSKSDGNIADVPGCVDQNGKFDEGCKCKKIFNKDGSNVCKKITSMPITSNSLGAAYMSSSGVPQMINAINQLASGNKTISDLDGKNMAIAFKKQADLNEQVINKVESKNGGKSPIPLTQNELQNAQSKLIPKSILDTGANSGSSMPNFQSSSNPAMKKAIDAIKAKTGLNLSGSGKGLSKKEDKKEAMNFNFNDGPQVSNGGNVVEYMDKKYNFKNNDISKDNGISIFEIISNRYIESGIRRLFEEK
jgi:hypothetical protein